VKKIQTLHKMKNKLALFLLFLFFLLLLPESCKKEPICACNIENPEENIKWIKDILTQSYSLDVFKYYFNSIEYIILADPPGPDAMRIVFDCDGNLLGRDGGYSAGSTSINLPYNFWDSYNENKILIYQQRIHPK